MDNEQEGMDKTAADPYPQDLEDLRRGLKKHQGMVARRSVKSSPGVDFIASWIGQACLKEYPAFIMGDQFVVYFREGHQIKQVSGREVIQHK